MSEKKYILELTAEELRKLDEHGTGSQSANKKLAPLVQECAKDRERDELRLPWRVAFTEVYGCGPGTWSVRFNPQAPLYPSEQAAKLMASAPELRDAALAVREWVWDNLDNGSELRIKFDEQCSDLIDFALTKIKTGAPREDYIYTCQQLDCDEAARYWKIKHDGRALRCFKHRPIGFIE